MKALASEIVRKLGKRLRWLAIEVRELTGTFLAAPICASQPTGTGDMQMTRAEIATTQIIVTTPEKWDVVTRKPTGEGEIASVKTSVFSRSIFFLNVSIQSLKLLIIDEVHLLNDERGAVIETIVARTLRQVSGRIDRIQY